MPTPTPIPKTITSLSQEKERILNQYREHARGRPDSELQITGTNERTLKGLDQAISEL